MDNGNSVSARDAYQHHRSAGLSTQGAVAVTVGEANRVNLSVVAQPVWNWPHHAVLDFNALPSKAARRKAARFLTKAADAAAATHLTGCRRMGLRNKHPARARGRTRGHDVTEQLLTEAGKRAIEEDYAERSSSDAPWRSVLTTVFRRRGGVPVIDPSIAALKRAEYAADLKRKCGWKPSRRWSCEPAPEEEIAAFGIIGDRDVSGNRLIVGAE